MQHIKYTTRRDSPVPIPAKTENPENNDYSVNYRIWSNRKSMVSKTFSCFPLKINVKEDSLFDLTYPL